MAIELDRVTGARDVLASACNAADRNNPQGDLDILASRAVEAIVGAIDRLSSIPIVGPLILGPFGPILRVLDDFAGDPSAIYAACDQLGRQADALREMPQSISQAVANSRQHWYDCEASDDFRTLATQYARIYSLAADVLAIQSGLTNQVAMAVVKTKGRVLQLVGGLIWDVTLSIAKFPLIPIPSEVDSWVRQLWATVRNVLYRIRDYANTLAAEANRLLGSQAGLGRAMDRAASLLNGSSAIDAFDEHGPGFTEDMRTATPHADDDLMSELIGAADSDKKLPEGWRRMTDAELAALGIDMGERDGDGFGGQVFMGPDGQLVVKFDGTDFSYAPDVVEDGVGGITMSEQSARAMEVAEALRKAGLGDDVVYTGTSLGGRLASVAAMSQGGVAVIFNAAGVSPGTMEYLAAQRGMSVDELYAEVNSGSVRLYVLEGEILTTLQEDFPVTSDVMPDAPGKKFTVQNNETTQGMNPVEKHTAHPQMGEAMREQWEEMRN